MKYSKSRSQSKNIYKEPCLPETPVQAPSAVKGTQQGPQGRARYAGAALAPLWMTSELRTDCKKETTLQTYRTGVFRAEETQPCCVPLILKENRGWA